MFLKVHKTFNNAKYCLYKTCAFSEKHCSMFNADKLCIVFFFDCQESPEEVSIGLPFLADLGLGLSVLSCTMLHLLYQGQEKTREEESCQHLLKSKLLQR